MTMTIQNSDLWQSRLELNSIVLLPELIIFIIAILQPSRLKEPQHPFSPAFLWIINSLYQLT